MIATELMVGDYILWNGTPSRVHTIAAPEQIRISNPMDLSELDSTYNFSIDPIPLTPNILKMNGWKWRKKGLISSMRLFDEEGHSIMTLTYGDLMSIGGHEIKINYVHELQHALRLCGLNDIADNLKIK